jgi:Holliday junction resolvase RusA-like endonuclease
MKAKPGCKPFVRVYDPGTAEGWKSAIALAAKEFVPFPPLQGPLEVSITFYFPRPRDHFKSDRVTLRAGQPAYHTSRPDRDNCEKAVLDALSVLGMWSDDSQVCCGEVRKLYAANGQGGAQITIREAPRITAPEPEQLSLA